MIAISGDQALHHRLTHDHGVGPGDDVDTDPGPEPRDNVEDTPGDTRTVHPETSHPEEAVEDQILPETGAGVTRRHGVGQKAETQAWPLTLVRWLDLGPTLWNWNAFSVL